MCGLVTGYHGGADVNKYDETLRISFQVSLKFCLLLV